LKPEWWGSPLAQEQKYQGRKKPVTRNDDDNDNNNSSYISLSLDYRNKKCIKELVWETSTEIALGRVISQPVSHWHLTAEVRVHSWFIPYEVHGGKRGTVIAFSGFFSFLLYHSSVALHAHISSA
jgi:hypothetical protein